MSALATALANAPARKTGEPAHERRRRLRLITPSLPERTTPFSLLCIGVMLLGVFALLLVNIYVSQGTYRVEQLTADRQALADRKLYLEEDIAYRSSPQNVAAAAEALGMKVDSNPSYIFLESGTTQRPDGKTTVDDNPGETVPGPRADVREDLRPDLGSQKERAAVDGDDADDALPDGRLMPPSQRQVP